MFKRFGEWLGKLAEAFGEIPLWERRSLARKYITGAGLEIGALHRPLRVPRGAKVTYVDRLWTPGLYLQYPELANRKLVPVNLVDDGEKLGRVGDDSQDFLIANHFLEHCQDPIGALGNFFRVLKPQGVLYLAVPDCRHTFDQARPVTPLDHLLRDHEQGSARPRREHFEEWVRLVNGVEEPAEVAEQVDHLMKTNYSIHYHVWTQREVLELIHYLQARLDFEVELFLQRRYEIIAILRKGAASAARVGLAA